MTFPIDFEHGFYLRNGAATIAVIADGNGGGGRRESLIVAYRSEW
jgi:hypothetical protein